MFDLRHSRSVYARTSRVSELKSNDTNSHDYVFSLANYVSVDFFVNGRVDFNAGDEHDLIHGQLATLFATSQNLELDKS